MMHKNRCLSPRQSVGKHFFNTIPLCGTEEKEQNIYIKVNSAHSVKKKETNPNQPTDIL